MKITFPSVDLGVSLSEIEYQYLKFICHQTLQTSDEVLRSQVRQLQLPGIPDFTTWRLEQSQQPQFALPEATTTVDVQLTSAEVEEPAVEELAVPLDRTAQNKKPRSNRRQTAAPKEFDPKKLRSEYKGRSLQDAVAQVLEQEPDRPFSVDDVIVQVYGEFSGNELTKARKSLGRGLSNGVREGLWTRSQERPPLYQARADAASSSSVSPAEEGESEK